MISCTLLMVTIQWILFCDVFLGEYSSQKNRESRREARNCEGTE